MDRARRPSCTVCGDRMALARIAPIERIHELRTFECAKCGQVDRYAVKSGSDAYWLLMRETLLPAAER
ncbi:hypothetical protein LPW26_03000 [Rhodopseudomonas sp. HC1]|uniref:hypothetical protein n=1 Tax=Rhodopseudomonas infernalis TaxID=2897386 RepID=UPI001EE792A0|nr:hypothetical protein [Rhodopseudomonas infernalis]MCG6203597.1 hypothetical protein [Rhodopseudomonas infernalis]